MIIAAHLFGSGNKQTYLQHCCKILAEKNPEDRFIFFADAQTVRTASFSSNCKILLVTPPLKNGLLLHYWYNFKLPALLLKYNVSVFLSESNACSLRTAVPQCLLITNRDILLGKKLQGPFSLYLRKFMRKFVSVASAITVTDTYLAKKFQEKYNIPNDQLIVARKGLPVLFGPLDTGQKLLQQEVISEGYEYFLFNCTPTTKANAITLLKAYSIFKKRLKSGLRLVICLQNTSIDETVPDLKNYKYKADVKFISNPSPTEYARVMAAAYSFVYLADDDAEKEPGLLAMKCHVPVIAVDGPGTISEYADAALLTSGDEKSLADQLMLLYKDETQRMAHIEKGVAVSALYTWDNASAIIQQTILQISKD